MLAVISHLNAQHLPYQPLEKRPPVDPQAGEQLHIFQGPDVLFVGQPIAVVVAETAEQARAAAALVDVAYYVEPAATELRQERAKPPTEASARGGRSGGSRGDAAEAFAKAPAKVDMWSSHEREQHNAMEPHATIAEWDGDHLTLYDKSQWVDNVRSEIAHVFGIPEQSIRVVSPFVGGAFGSALRTWPHVTIAALAARQAGRAVRIELTRRELYVSLAIGRVPNSICSLELPPMAGCLRSYRTPSHRPRYTRSTPNGPPTPCCAPTRVPMCRRDINWRR